jgi:UDP-MurNAc hydroxylase
MPFAGTYVLGGRLSELNDMRGVPTLSDGLARIEAALDEPGRGFLLNAGETYDLATRRCSSIYVEPSAEELRSYLDANRTAPYDYDTDVPEDDAALMAMAETAWSRFSATAKKIGYASETEVVVTDGNGFRVGFGADHAPRHLEPSQVEQLPSFVEITVDRRLLGRLLKGPRFAHWNNAEIGSHLHYRRKPDVFERALYYSLSSFHV